MTVRHTRHTTAYGTPSYPVPLILGAQDGADSRHYWSTGKTVRNKQEALRVAGKLLPSSCEALDAKHTFTRKSDPLWLVTVGVSEGSGADKLAEILNVHFGKYNP